MLVCLDIQGDHIVTNSNIVLLTPILKDVFTQLLINLCEYKFHHNVKSSRTVYNKKKNFVHIITQVKGVDMVNTWICANNFYILMWELTIMCEK